MIELNQSQIMYVYLASLTIPDSLLAWAAANMHLTTAIYKRLKPITKRLKPITIPSHEYLPV